MMGAPGHAHDGHVDGPLDPAVPRQPIPGPINPELALTLMSRIWSAGIEVAAIGALIGDGPLSDRATAIVGELDAVIRDIRAGASALPSPAGRSGAGLPARMPYSDSPIPRYTELHRLV